VVTACPYIAPRHGMGPERIGDWIYGGAPMRGGSIQSAADKAFTPGQLPRFVRAPRIVVRPRSGTPAASTGVAGSKPAHSR
jgi:hypothetical protein